MQLYRLRWRIEQTFRALKSDGLALEDSQIIDVDRIFNLAAVGFVAAIRIIQLVDARDGGPRPASDVIDGVFPDALQRISNKLEGKTERQKIPTVRVASPSSPGSLLDWAAGIATTSLPVRNHANRLNRLAATLDGYMLANQSKNP